MLVAVRLRLEYLIGIGRPRVDLHIVRQGKRPLGRDPLGATPWV